MTLSAGSREFLLAFADDEHMVGARHTEWIGLGPFLEEDLAFCSIAQDELGHAIALYERILGAEGDATGEVDRFALLRSADEYRSCALAELECSDWSDSLVRHWLYDRAETLRWEALLASTEPRIAMLAERALREEAFHLSHAEQFMSRIAPSKPGEIIDSISRLIPIACGMWAPVAGEAEALAAGVTTESSAALAENWELAIRGDLARWDLEIAWPGRDQIPTADRTQRSDGFDELIHRLQRVVVLDEAAIW